MNKENEVLKDLVRADLANSTAASNLAFNEKVKGMIRSGRKVYHFAFGQSPFPIPPCLVRAMQEYAHVHDYLPMTGIPELREELVKFHARYDHLDLNGESMVVGPGSKELIYLTMATFSGEILLPAPAWTTYAPQARLAGKETRILQTDRAKGWKLTPEVLEEAGRRGTSKKLLILTNPGNPTGTCYKEEELKALSLVCRRHGILVLSDEIYARLTFDRKYSSMVKCYPEGTILTSGFSKWASAGGWRLGYAHFPPATKPLMEAVRNGASHTYSCAPAPMQYGVAKALREHKEELDRYMTDCSRILGAVGSFCHRELSSVGVSGSVSEAGYYFMPDFEVVRAGLRARGMTTGDHMSKAMLEEADVAVMSAHAFLRPPEEFTTRFCFVCFDGSNALEAAQGKPASETLGDDFVRQYCSPVVEGVERLKSWVVKHTV
ncbi:aspartate aminotransferase [Penaeus vannamei]|uniref:aspartate aminotransferase n=1 Tax=Penaeus vannamei TaxID=6689 RepID=UPI00387FA43F